MPQRRVVSGHVLCGGILAGAVRFGGVRFCQRPQADEQRQGESQHRHPQPHGALHLHAGGREPPSAPAPTAEQRGRPLGAEPRDPIPVPMMSHIPCPIAMPMSPPSRYSRRRLQRRERLRARRGACARGSGLPSAGLRASPGCFKSSPAGRRGLGRSRLGSPGPLLSPPFPPQTSARALPREGPARRHRGGGRPRRPGKGGRGKKKARKHLKASEEVYKKGWGVQKCHIGATVSCLLNSSVLRVTCCSSEVVPRCSLCPGGPIHPCPGAFLK